MYNRDTNALSIFLAFLVGGLLGAGITLLVAPQAGRKTRAMIRDKGMEIKDRAVESVEDTRNRASHAIDEIAQQTKERAASLTQRGKEKVEEQAGQIRKKAKQVRA